MPALGSRHARARIATSSSARPRWSSTKDLQRHAVICSRDVYWLVFDPFDHEDTEPVCGSLNDDLLDVYFDVHRGLALWNAGHRDAAVWHWRFDFDSHWGAHAIQALGALHHASA